MVTITYTLGGLLKVLTLAEDTERARGKCIPEDAADVRVIDASELPTDRTFRDAWRDQGGIVVDMPAAREIHKERLREVRAPLLEALDIEYTRADEQKNDAKKAEIAAKRQALRDVTSDPAIEVATTPEALKAVLPDVLKKKK